MSKDKEQTNPTISVNIRWRLILIIIVCIAVTLGTGIGIYSGFFSGVITALHLIAIGCFFLMLIVIGISPLMESIVDTLIHQIPKHRSIWNWFLLISFLSFLCFTLLIVFYILAADPTTAISAIKNSWSLLIISFLVFVFSLSFTLLSTIFDIKLSSVLSGHISSEMIENSPQAAIEHSFTVFENHLRNKMGVTSIDSADKLINDAFGKKQRLIYSTVDNEQQGIRNLISGANAVFRNPRKHQIIEDEKKTVKTIILLIDYFIQIIDKSEINDILDEDSKELSEINKGAPP